MFLTRLCNESRAAVTGDLTQVDLPRGVRSGLAQAVRILDGIDGIGMIRFTDADIVRHPLVSEVVRAYDRESAARRTSAAAARGDGGAVQETHEGAPEGTGRGEGGA